jgi:hypothetical protein
MLRVIDSEPSTKMVEFESHVTVTVLAAAVAASKARPMEAAANTCNALRGIVFLGSPGDFTTRFDPRTLIWTAPARSDDAWPAIQPTLQIAEKIS